jgi:putative phosphoesterase
MPNRARRVAFISDLHANLIALEAVLADIDASNVDEVVCLGDIVDLGPEPQAVIDRLRQRGVRCIRGNHDTLDEHPQLPVLLEIEAWTSANLDAATLAELASLPEQLEIDLAGARLLCVHGSPNDVNDQILAETPTAELLGWTSGRSFDVLVCGHTHVQTLRRIDAQVFVNVGSCGMPFARPFAGETPRVLGWAEYAIIGASDSGNVSVDFRRVRYDVDRFAESLRAAGFPDAEHWLDNWIR